MTSPRDTLKAFIDAAADRVARVIADVRREAGREREVREAEHRARMAELSTALASLQAAEMRLTERLATLKDGEPGRDGRDGVDGAPGLNGADAPAVTAEQVAEAVAAYLADNPPTAGRDGAPGQDGKDADPEMIRQMIEAAVAQIPVPKDGAPGRDGRDGTDGAAGRDGKMPVVRAWQDHVHYEGDVVFHAGSSWQALRDTGRAPPHEDWQCIAAAGRDGVDGRSFVPRGLYDPGNEYAALDVVMLGGSSFVAKADGPGPCPGDGWFLLASRGKSGPPGERGPALRGERGPAGPPVAALAVDDEGVVTLTNADGSRVACDLYPLLAKLDR